MDQISDATAERLKRSVDRVCDLVEEEGHTPTDAVVKVAKERGLHREQMRLLCHGYNTGVTNTTRREGKTFSEKFAALPLAHADKAIEAVFSSEPKPTVKAASVVADVYRMPLDVTPVVKVAAVVADSPTVDPLYSPTRGCVDRRTPYELATEKLAELRTVRKAADKAERVARQKIAAVTDAYLGHYGLKPTALVFLHKWAADIYGNEGRILVNQIADRVITSSIVRDKYAAETSPTKGLLSESEPRTKDHPVMIAIKEAVDATRDWLLQEVQLPKHALEITRQMSKLYPTKPVVKKSTLLPPGETHEAREEAHWKKRADVLSAAVGAASSRLAGGGAPSGPTDYSKARLQINDPKHQATMRRLQAEAMLNRLINTDDVISSYNPQDVADAWYELNESSPGVVNNLSLLRANIRRQLQGNLTPYEARELVMSGINTQSPSVPVIQGLESQRAPSLKPPGA